MRMSHLSEQSSMLSAQYIGLWLLPPPPGPMTRRDCIQTLTLYTPSDIQTLYNPLRPIHRLFTRQKTFRTLDSLNCCNILKQRREKTAKIIMTKVRKGLSQGRCDVVVPCVHLYSRKTQSYVKKTQISKQPGTSQHTNIQQKIPTETHI